MDPTLGVPPFRDQGSQRPWSRNRPGSRHSRQGCRGRALDTRDEGAGSQYRRRPQDRSRRRLRGSALRVAPQRITRGASQRSDDNSAAVGRASTPGGAPLGLSADKAALRNSECIGGFVECAAVEQSAQSVVGEVSESEGVTAQCFQTAVDRFGGAVEAWWSKTPERQRGGATGYGPPVPPTRRAHRAGGSR